MYGKIKCFFVATLLLVVSFAVAIGSATAINSTRSICKEIKFTSLELNENKNHCIVGLENANPYLIQPSKSILPAYRKAFPPEILINDAKYRKKIADNLVAITLEATLLELISKAADKQIKQVETATLQSNSINKVTICCPAEFDPVDELIISWPKKYGDESYECEPFYVQIVDAAEDAVQVRINVNSYPMFNIEASEGGYIVPPNKDRPIPALQTAGVSFNNVTIDEIMTHSTWIRDYGPFFITKNEKLELVDYGYYGFRLVGGRIFDNIYPIRYGFKYNIKPTIVTNFLLNIQGGNLISDGKGTAFLCWDRLERDNKLTKEQVEFRLKYYLGFDKVVFLDSQIIDTAEYGDQTGHIDMFAKMLNENTFLIAEWRDGDPWTNGQNAEIVDRNAQKLADMGYDVIRIPTIRDPNDPHVIWTYTNSLIINGVNKKVVLVPQYGAPEDFEAISIYERALPDYEIRPIDCSEIIKFYGAIHCTTITRPLVVRGGGK